MHHLLSALACFAILGTLGCSGGGSATRIPSAEISSPADLASLPGIDDEVVQLSIQATINDVSINTKVSSLRGSFSLSINGEPPVVISKNGSHQIPTTLTTPESFTFEITELPDDELCELHSDKGPVDMEGNQSLEILCVSSWEPTWVDLNSDATASGSPIAYGFASGPNNSLYFLGDIAGNSSELAAVWRLDVSGRLLWTSAQQEQPLRYLEEGTYYDAVVDSFGAMLVLGYFYAGSNLGEPPSQPTLLPDGSHISSEEGELYYSLTYLDNEGNLLTESKIDSWGIETVLGFLAGEDGKVYVVGSDTNGLVITVRRPLEASTTTHKVLDSTFFNGNIAWTADKDIVIVTSIDAPDLLQHRLEIIKTDDEANVLWSQSVDLLDIPLSQDGSAFVIESIGVDSMGNIYVGGAAEAKNLFGQVNAGLEDAFLMKLDPLGRYLWTRLVGGPEVDLGIAVIVDGEDNVYLGGDTYGEIGGNSLVGTAENLQFKWDSDIFLSKWDGDGNMLWLRQAGTENRSNLLGLSIDAEADIIVGGRGFLAGFDSTTGKSKTLE